MTLHGLDRISYMMEKTLEEDSWEIRTTGKIFHCARLAILQADGVSRYNFKEEGRDYSCRVTTQNFLSEKIA